MTSVHTQEFVTELVRFGCTSFFSTASTDGHHSALASAKQKNNIRAQLKTSVHKSTYAFPPPALHH